MLSLRTIQLSGALALFAGALSAAPAAVSPPPRITAQQYLQDVKFLASKQMRGRGDGTPQLDKAASFIAQQFQSAGLQPVVKGSYFQDFPVTLQSKLGGGNQMTVTNGGARQTLRPRADFQPFSFSSSETVTGPVVFVGYGISAEEYRYDDYAGVDVKDKIVLLLRHEPREFDDKSPFEGRVYTQHAQFANKAINARLHGAKGVLLVNDAANHTGDADELEKFGEAAGPGDVGLPFVQIRIAAADELLRASGKTVKNLQEEIDHDLKPHSLPLAGSATVLLQTDLERTVKTVHNVAGYLPGSTEEYVVIGAHYDHLGLGEQFSMAPSRAGTVHPGADDNASGTAGVIELARYFGQQPKQRRGILFLAFAGEELGLLGSSYWVNHPVLDLKNAVSMINMDMIGRIRDGKVFVGGAATGSTLKQTLDAVASPFGFHLNTDEQPVYGSSDHTSFVTKQIPVLFFFSGLHSDYHKPSDTWDKIDARQSARLLDLVAAVTERLRADEARPQFVRVAETSANPHGGGDVAREGQSANSSKSGYGPYFGSIPDFAEVPKGIRFADVREGSPAAKAGLKGGDIMVEFDGKEVRNLYDFTYLLRSKKAGDRVHVKVLRENNPVETDVLLAERK